MQKLNQEQCKMVNDNLDIVSVILRNCIHTNQSVRGLEWDDLYQSGCIGLCKAAVAFNGSCSFKTFAAAVVKNELLNICRKLQVQWRKMPEVSLFDTLSGDESSMLFDVLAAPDETADKNAEAAIKYEFSEIKKNHSGIVLKGIQALELRYKGYSGADIAALYHVEAKHVFAWISKAKKRLELSGELGSLLESCK